MKWRGYPNLSARPPQPALNNGKVQRRIRRAYAALGKPVLTTSELMRWTHPRPGGNRDNHRRAIRGAAKRYCDPVARVPPYGAWLWRLKSPLE
jgi:hypothetical protein